MFSIDHILILCSILLFVSVVASKISDKLGVPTLLFFLLIGMFVSQVAPEIAHVKNRDTTKLLGIITLTFVLFFGGVETSFSHVRAVLKRGIVLSTLGVLITTFIVGFFLQWATGGKLNLTEGLLLGSIVASTDAAVVFSILRSHNIKLKAGLGPLLELESGSNDVMVYFLMTFLLSLLKGHNTSIYFALPIFFQEMILGALGGVVMGYVILFVVNKIHLSYPGLYSPLVFSLIFMTYGMVNSLHGSGFLAVYIAGMILGNQDFIHKKGLIRFYKGISWLMQIVMFIALGLLVVREQMLQVLGLGILLSLVLMLIARPISVFVSLLGSEFNFKQKFFISWIGLRGAVPIIFATYLYVLEEQKAHMMFHLIFIIVLVSIFLQGTTLRPLARWLKLEDTALSKRDQQFLNVSDEVKKMLIELEIPVGSPASEKPIVELGFPQNALIALIYRDKRYLTAQGSTLIKPHDRLLIMVDAKKDLKAIKACLGVK